jgi:hypothetical protein
MDALLFLIAFYLFFTVTFIVLGYDRDDDFDITDAKNIILWPKHIADRIGY